MGSGDRLVPAMECEACPVLKAWAGSPCVAQRLLKSRILAVNHATLGRPALSDNVEVLAPLINHLGTLDGSMYTNSMAVGIHICI